MALRPAGSTLTLPKGVWSLDANAKRQVPEGDQAVAKLLGNFAPSHNFRRDLLAYCTLRNLIPHPKLLPLHPDEEERQGAASSETSTNGNIYDLNDVENISVKHWQIDDGNYRALCFTLPFATKIRSVCLFNVGLNKEQVAVLCSTIPKTHVAVLQLEWNPIAVAATKEAGENHVTNATPSMGSPSRPSSASQSASRSPPVETATNNSKQQHELRMQQDLQSGGENDVSEMFAQLINEESALVFLSLRANGISSRGATALARALRTNKTLEALNLFQNSIGDAGARAFAYALPFNTTLKTLSLANNQLTGHGVKLLVDGLTKYVAPPELLSEFEAAETVIHTQIEQAKKAKKKLDRATIIAQLGLPVLEIVDGVQFAPGNSTLEELLLSGNTDLDASDLATVSETLEKFKSKLKTHLRCIKLQRLPKSRAHTIKDPQHLSEFIKL
ncbi:hypothetical protein PHYBOEH_010442 [Phytophthora boehmeriae]|uniref:Uncharacterized protein n=1 Tax=Phytophthora boehmeriae TaxID=109152 RepID=A0A8T1X5A9_9STRA|nr:hypothetical protein PHYBOEH_010442 [Phytophthora boehmeriae]